MSGLNIFFTNTLVNKFTLNRLFWKKLNFVSYCYMYGSHHANVIVQGTTSFASHLGGAIVLSPPAGTVAIFTPSTSILFTILVCDSLNCGYYVQVGHAPANRATAHWYRDIPRIKLRYWSVYKKIPQDLNRQSIIPKKILIRYFLKQGF